MHRSYQLCRASAKAALSIARPSRMVYDPRTFLLDEGAIIKTWIILVAVGAIGLLCPLSQAQLHVLVDQVGYETGAPKLALVQETAQDHPRHFTLIDTDSGKT